MRPNFIIIGVEGKFFPDISVSFNKALPLLIIKTGSGWLIKSFTRRLKEYLPQKLYFFLPNFQYSVNKKIAIHPTLSGQTRLTLRSQYIQDVQHFQNLPGTGLSNWLVVE